MLWKTVFYTVIEEFRRRIKAATAQGQKGSEPLRKVRLHASLSACWRRVTASALCHVSLLRQRHVPHLSSWTICPATCLRGRCHLALSCKSNCLKVAFAESGGQSHFCKLLLDHIWHM